MKKTKEKEPTKIKKDKKTIPDNFSLLNIDGEEYKTTISKKYLNRKPYIPTDPNKAFSFIPGTIQKILVAEGDEVICGDRILILEAMKMKNIVLAAKDGFIDKIHVEVGELVPKGHLLFEYK